LFEAENSHYNLWLSKIAENNAGRVKAVMIQIRQVQLLRNYEKLADRAECEAAGN
jgi:hypothetical protein